MRYATLGCQFRGHAAHNGVALKVRFEAVVPFMFLQDCVHYHAVCESNNKPQRSTALGGMRGSSVV